MSSIAAEAKMRAQLIESISKRLVNELDVDVGSAEEYRPLANTFRKAMRELKSSPEAVDQLVRQCSKIREALNVDKVVFSPKDGIRAFAVDCMELAGVYAANKTAGAYLETDLRDLVQKTSELHSDFQVSKICAQGANADIGVETCRVISENNPNMAPIMVENLSNAVAQVVTTAADKNPVLSDHEKTRGMSYQQERMNQLQTAERGFQQVNIEGASSKLQRSAPTL